MTGTAKKIVLLTATAVVLGAASVAGVGCSAKTSQAPAADVPVAAAPANTNPAVVAADAANLARDTAASATSAVPAASTPVQPPAPTAAAPVQPSAAPAASAASKAAAAKVAAQAVIVHNCTGCHSSSRLLGYRATSASAAQRVAADMGARAGLSAKERGVIAAYYAQ